MKTITNKHFDFYEDLPETCSYEIEPYYNRMVQLVDDYDIYDYGIMQSYDVYDGDDVSGWMQCSIEYEDVCVRDNKFLVLGAIEKNIWYYLTISTCNNNISICIKYMLIFFTNLYRLKNLNPMF